MPATPESPRNAPLSPGQVGRAVMHYLLETKTDQPDTCETIAHQQWEVLPLAERDLLTAIAFAAYPDPGDIAAREALTRYALVANHIRSQVEQTAILETLFTRSNADDNEAVPPQS